MTPLKNHHLIGMDHPNSYLGYLPRDLFLEILLKMSIKSLNQCCCVCKSWRNFIRSDDFIKSHLNRSLQDNPFNLNKAIICSEVGFRKNHMWNISQLPYYFFVGCLNGILCYYSKSRISNSIIVHLWNPATQSFRSIPEGYLNNTYNKKILVLFYFDSMTDDYLVVKLFFWNNQNLLAFMGEVYSLKTNSWKVINLSSWSIKRLVGSNIVVYNGAIHCIATSISREKVVLGTFYMDEERYVECDLPCTNFKEKPMASLGSSNEFLSLSFWRDEFEIWVMKKYGVWTKKYVLANSPLVHSPFGITDTGKLLAINWNGEDVVYDPKKQSIMEYVHNKAIFLKGNANYSMPTNNHVRVAEYVESMVSVFPPAQKIREGNALVDSTSM